MVLNFAGGYIAMGDDIEEKQQYLNSAVSAWNIACLDEKARKRSIKKYMAEYRKLNPRQSKRDFRVLNDYASKRGELLLTIPMACFEARK